MKRIKEIIVLILVLIGLTYGLTLLFENDQDLTRFNVLIEKELITPFGTQYSMGSGVIISEDGLVITAGHVLEGASSVRITLHDGRVFDITDFYIDKTADVGFIDLPCSVKDFVPLSDSNIVTENDCITHIGNPWGIWTDKKIKGFIEKSKFQRIFAGKDVDLFLLKLAVEPGCSGGGLYFNGKLIGIITMGFEDLSIAIVSNECKEVLERYVALGSKQ